MREGADAVRTESRPDRTGVRRGGTVATFGTTALGNGVVPNADTEDDGGQRWMDAMTDATVQAAAQVTMESWS